ncbi:MAG: dockerin type I repeat-containing protein, partial [Phycisphaerales bacterium]
VSAKNLAVGLTACALFFDFSNDGTNWVLMEQIATNLQWAVKTYDLGSFVSLNASVQVRFVVTDNPNNSVTEAAIDEFQVYSVECVQAPACPSDLNGDGTTNAADLSTLLNSWGTAKADLNADGTTNAADLSLLLNGWGPCQ